MSVARRLARIFRPSRRPDTREPAALSEADVRRLQRVQRATAKRVRVLR